MIFWVLLLFIVAHVVFIYFKNKQNDRARHRRERLHENSRNFWSFCKTGKNYPEILKGIENGSIEHPNELTQYENRF